MMGTDPLVVARTLGVHALAWYLVVLAGLLAGEGVAWSVRGRRHRLDAAALGRHRRSRAPLALGIGLILVALAGFGGIAYVTRNGAFAPADQVFLDAIRTHVSAQAIKEFSWITWFGDARTLALLCIGTAAVLLARGDRALAVGMLVSAIGNGVLSVALKRLFDRSCPRLEMGEHPGHSLCFPSGHTSGAVVVYGMLAYTLIRTLPRRWHLAVLMSATTLIFTIGCSRVFVQAHFPSDVLAGFASGGAWLAVVVVCTESWLRGLWPTFRRVPSAKGHDARRDEPRGGQAFRPGLMHQLEGRWLRLSERPRSIAGLIVGFTALRLLLAAMLPLLPEEAYYWSWSRELDWSFFDHPPLSAYVMALTTAAFGQTVFGIKLAAVLWSLGWNVLWARLILDMYGDRRLAFWSLAALNLTLLYLALGVASTPDAPLIFGWIGAIWSVWRATQSADSRWWLAAGAFVGLSWLGKYSGALLLPIVLAYLASTPTLRPWLRKPQPWLATLLALAIFGPVLYWNAQHEWASLAFQSSRRVGEMHGIKPGYLLQLLATQFAVVTPYVFVLAVGALWRGARLASTWRLDNRSRLLLLSGAVPIVLFALVSLRSLVKINWLAPAYWSLTILGIQQVLTKDDGTRRLMRGLASSAVVLALAIVVAAVPKLPLRGGLDTWSGWDEIARRVDKVAALARSEGHEVFVFTPEYRASSMLRFHLPGQPRTYAQDIYGEPALQFDYFPLPSSLQGATGIFVLDARAGREFDLRRLSPYCDTIERVDEVDTVAFGKPDRHTEIYRCTGYHGHPRAARGLEH